MQIKDLTFDLLKSKTEELLKTLPIAHYLKIKTIEIVFDENAQTSYFDPKNYNIHLALANIVMAISGSKKTEINDIDLEKHIRNTLYHEVSHAILTPPNLFNEIENYRKYYENQKANDPNFQFEWLLTPSLANIIEDERIETLLKDYYLLVDFKRNIYEINGGISNAKTFEQFVFNAVRFRYSPLKNKEINDKVNCFISRNARVNSMNSGCLATTMNELLQFLKSIWEELIKNQPKQNSSQNNSSSDEEDDSSSTTEDNTQTQDNESSQSENGENADSSQEETDKNSQNGNAEEQESSSKQSLEDESSNNGLSTESEEDIDIDVEDIESMLSSLTEEQMESIIASAVMEWKKSAQRNGKYTITLEDIHEDKQVLTEMIKIIVKNTGVGVANSPSQYGYCGRFNAKRFMKDYNDSYKWFEKKSYADNPQSKNAQDKVLNIFLDNSGSYWNYDDATNKVLKALYEIEKRYSTFKFNLICWGSAYLHQKGVDRLSRATQLDWGTSLRNFRKVYKDFNQTGKEYNILLTDGSINCIEEIDAMNNNKSVVISSSANKKTIKTLCKNAKAVIFADYDYASALAQNVINALDSLF